MKNLEECFYHVLTNFILLHKNIHLLKSVNRNKTLLCMVSVNAVTKDLL